MKAHTKVAKELYDICEFCADLHGENKRKTCSSPCTCATYCNQDYVAQKEFTIGLPIVRSWDPTLVPPGATDFWASLSEQSKERIKNNLPTILRELDPVLQRFLLMLLQGSTKETICQALKINDKTYDKYTERLRQTSGMANS